MKAVKEFKCYGHYHPDTHKHLLFVPLIFSLLVMIINALAIVIVILVIVYVFFSIFLRIPLPGDKSFKSFGSHSREELLEDAVEQRYINKLQQREDNLLSETYGKVKK